MVALKCRYAKLTGSPDPAMLPASRHRGDGVVWRTHLGQNLVQPLQRPVQVDLDPARGAGDVLPVVLCAPPLEDNGKSYKQQACSTPKNKNASSSASQKKHLINFKGPHSLSLLCADLLEHVQQTNVFQQ